jgi:acetolactate synthase small subunit
MTRTIVAHVENVPGVLARVDGLFRRHSLPVESLHFEAGSGASARLTVTLRAPADAAALIVRQMRRFGDVREAHETVHESPHENVARLRPAG